jgi:cytochrome P450
MLIRRGLIQKYGCKSPSTILDLNITEIDAKAAQEHKYLETTADLFTRYGRTHKVFHFGRTVIRTCDPEVAKAIYSTQFNRFGLQPIRYEGGKGFFGNGILVTDGPHWKASRALVRPAFDIAHIANFDRL